MQVRLAAFISSLTLASSITAQAQVMVDFSKITCEQYVFSKVAPPRTIAVWLSGYYSGKRNSAEVDLQKVESNAGRVERFCRQQKNFKLPVMEAVEQVLGKPQ